MKFSTFLVIVHIATVHGVPLAETAVDEMIDNAHNKYVVRHPGMNSHPDHGGIRVEGDLIISKDEYANQVVGNVTKRRAWKSEVFRWPDAVVSYSFEKGKFIQKEKDEILKSMAAWEKETCISFKNVGGASGNKVEFVRKSGCYSWVGMAGGGAQDFSLGTGCIHYRVIIHELGHAIGFQHEHTRPDRDNYVTINKANIYPSNLYNFRKFSKDLLTSMGVEYDYKSAMHYGGTYFSYNNRDSITTKDPAYQDVIGRYKTLSFSDVKLANLIYKCAQKNNCPKTTCPGEGFVDSQCKCRCPGTPTIICGQKPKPTPKPKPIEPTTTTKIECVNKNPQCETWARHNYCRTKWQFMKVNCRKACYYCSTESNGRKKKRLISRMVD